MAKRLEVNGNFMKSTDTLSGIVEHRIPTAHVNYRIYSDTLHIIYINRYADDFYIPLTEIVDKNNNPFASTDDLEFFLDSKLGGQVQIETLAQDNDSPDISLYMAQKLDDITVLVDVALNDETINVETTGVTPIIGNFMCLRDDTSFFQAEIMLVTPIAGNQYTLDVSIPFDYPYTTNAGCELQNVDMDVDGSVTPVEFNLIAKGLNLFAFDINRMVISMVMSTSGDDGLFGNLTKLPNGIYFRTVDGISKNLFNARDNSDFAEEAAGDMSYTTRSSGGGSFGARGRITFNGQDKRGVVKRLFVATEDKFMGMVRDDLTGLNKFRVKLQGQVAID